MTTPQKIGQNCLMFNARRASRNLTRVYEQAFRTLDLTGGQFSILACLAGRGAMAITPLAEALGMDRTSLTRALAPLQRRGFVESADDLDDSRSRLVNITKEGREQFEQAVPLWESSQKRLSQRLTTTELNQFLTVLRKMGKA